MKIHFIRHQKTQWNEQGRIQGNLNSELLNDKENIALKTANYLEENNVKDVYFSPLKRCTDTLKLICEHYKIENQKSDDRLMELNHGFFEGKFLSDLSQEEIKEKNKDPWFWKWPGGESYYQLSLRIKDFKKFLDDFEKSNNIAIISHEGVIKVFIKELLDLDNIKFGDLKVPNNVIYSLDNRSINFITLSDVRNLILSKF